MKTTLIIPDLHHKWRLAEKIIAAVKADQIIFLGDYYDDFGDGPEQVRETCEWFIDSVNKPNRIHLFGNHDQHYAYSYRTFQCSGYEQWKYFLIYDFLPRDIWDKVRWYYFLDDRWLLSHGGLHKFNLPTMVTKFRKDRKKFIAEISGYLDYEIRKGFQAGAEGTRSWIFNAGQARWGNQRVGGITWCDFEREFNPIKGINQIVGHTPQQYGVKWCRLTKDGKVFHHPYSEWTPTPEMLDDPSLSSNTDLDVWQDMHWATWDGKKLIVGSHKDL